jgi:hypothetical protein
MLSPMYLPLIKPVWSKSINFSRTLFNLLEITPKPILYTVFSSDIGLQFLAHLAFRPCELLSSLFVRPSTFHILIFSSETSGPIATKLWWNGPWMAPFQNCVRWSRLPTKMAAKLKIEKRGGSNFNCPLLL